MLLVGDDVKPEEGDLFLGEAVLLDERRRGLGVHHRHLRLEADVDRGDRLDERPARLPPAPALQPERLGQELVVLLRVDDLLARLAAVLGEVEQHLGMAHRIEPRLADDAFLLGDVLEQEVAHLLHLAVAVNGGEHAGSGHDEVVVLLDPLAEQVLAQLAGVPRLAPRVDRRVALLDCVFELQAKRAFCHGALPNWSRAV